jgi:RHS repeat-associated protein
VLRSYLWGKDLSGNFTGAGGVGGLLFIKIETGLDATNAGTYFPACDGNGNVLSLTKAADGTQAASYEYSPFGELLRTTGPAAKFNVIRFSTKYEDLETGLHYYGYRFYSAQMKRWLNRDPLGERED